MALPELGGEPQNPATLLAISAQLASAPGTMTAVLVGVTGKTTYVTGFDITGGGGAASVIDITITGLTTAIGTLHWGMNVLGTATGPVNAQGGLFVRFPTPLPGAALAGSITLTVPTFGAGNTEAACVLYGFTQ